jgi:hypothetical protein
MFRAVCAPRIVSTARLPTFELNKDWFVEVGPVSIREFRFHNAQRCLLDLVRYCLLEVIECLV